MAVKVNVQAVGIEKSIRKGVDKVNRSGTLKVNLNERAFSQPLGRITASASEFEKSIEASNARVLAFGASVGVLNTMQNAFSAMAEQAIFLEKTLNDINVILGASAESLDRFGSALFDIAKDTAQGFGTVAEAALEFSRQGLSMEEVLRRTNDALILTRITSLDAASSVKGLTAAVNGFADAGLSTTDIIDKLSAVDVRFAVSSEDLINALGRAGAVAQDAGVSFDELMGVVTAAQQITARGGNVIGNSFKTIFTRIQRSSTINRLEELGIAVRDVQGSTLPAMKIMQELATTYDTLSDSAKAAVSEQVGGVFQINILKAIMKDLGSANSIASRATLASADAAGEAALKNEKLNKTLSALLQQTKLSAQELAGVLGELSLKPLMESLFDFAKITSEFLTGGVDGESWGSDLAKGMLKGLGNILKGPGLMVLISLLFKLFGSLLKFISTSLQEFTGIYSIRTKQKQVEDAILNVLRNQTGLEAELLALSGNRQAQEKKVLDLIKAQGAALAQQKNIASAIAPGLVSAGVGKNLQIKKGRAEGEVPEFNKKKLSEGDVPNFFSAAQAEASQASVSYNRKVNASDTYSTVLEQKGRKTPVQVNRHETVFKTAKEVERFTGMPADGGMVLPPKNTKVEKKEETN